jgi:tRNA G18 (ribose-2'-O)-methylase SpoU
MGQTDEPIIDSLKDPWVDLVRRALGQVGRSRATCFLAEGRRLVEQALEAKAPIEAVFYRPEADLETADLLRRASAATVACRCVSKGIFFRVLDLGYETAADVLAVVRRPDTGSFATITGERACVLVGECVQDPRNVGVIVRTADAWKLSGAVFGAGSADPYSRAATRSTTGSIFRVPIVTASDIPAYLRSLKAGGLRIVGSSARAPAPCWDADLTRPCALVLGNETSGLSAEAALECDEVVAIPMAGGASSFNVTVAAGILLYERARQMVATAGRRPVSD